MIDKIAGIDFLSDIPETFRVDKPMTMDTEADDEYENNILLQFDRKNPLISVYVEQPDNIFICGIIGSVDIDALKRIQEDLMAAEEFGGGEGIYYFECFYTCATYDGEGYGFVEGDYWEFKQLKFDSFEEMEARENK